MSVKIIAAAVRQWAAVEDGGLNPMQVRELLKALDAESEPLELRDDAEREAVRVALAECFYLATDECRQLRKEAETADADELLSNQEFLAAAERRRMRYSQLHDRLLASAPPTTPPGADPVSRTPLEVKP